MKITNVAAVPPAPVEQIPPAVLRRIAHAHKRAQRLLHEATLLVEEQQDLEGIVVGHGAAEDEDGYNHVRETTGLVSLDSMLGNVAAVISEPGGGLWCGGAPRPWPITAWPLDDVD
jgi:hypothetical protein